MTITLLWTAMTFVMSLTGKVTVDALFISASVMLAAVAVVRTLEKQKEV